MIRWFLISLSIALLPSLCFGWGAGDGRGFIGGTTEASVGCTLTSQDFTTWDDQDATPSQMSVDADSITLNSYSENDKTVYVRKDFGADYFDQSFEARFKVTRTNTQNWSVFIVAALTNSTSNLVDVATTGDLVHVNVRNSDTSRYIRLHVIDGGTNVTGSPVLYSPVAEDTEYYLIFGYDSTVGTYGQYSVEIRTGSYSGTLLDTLTVNATETPSYRYYYAYDAWNTGSESYTHTGTITDYEIGLCD